MKVKKLLRFYFCADGLERAFENIMLQRALSSSDRPCEECANKLLEVLKDKDELSRLWDYIDKILSPMRVSERAALAEYAALRTGLKSLSEENYRRCRRAVVKFTRRARRLESFKNGICAVSKYYCLMPPH